MASGRAAVGAEFSPSVDSVVVEVLAESGAGVGESLEHPQQNDVINKNRVRIFILIFFLEAFP